MKEFMKLGLASALLGAMLTMSACSSTEEQAELAAEPAIMDATMEENTSIQEDTTAQADTTMPEDTSAATATDSVPAQDVSLGASSSGLGH